MNQIVPITAVGFCLLACFASGWLLECGHSQQRAVKVAVSSSEGKTRELDCEHAPKSTWHTVRIFFYEPAKTSYNVDWEICAGEPAEQRVRVTDASFRKVFFQFEDDEVERVEMLDLLGNNVPQLLVLTLSAGTGDDIQWHVIGESNGVLQEWKPPDYDAAAEKLLQPGEDFGYKDWNFHLQGNEIILARGVYAKNDGNCCPSRGGVLVRLMPIDGGFKLESAVRISKPEYHRWDWEPFCRNCKLY